MEYENYKSRALLTAAKYGDNWVTTAAGKKFLALNHLVRERIPSNPSNPEHRLGNALGDNYRHWFRGKFLQQYRVFFRYSSRSQVIVYAWVNNPETLRAYGSKTAAYLVFKKMLESGRVPNNWDELIEESKKLS